MIKLVKRCLKKVILNSRLTHEELLTLMKEVENVINNRPLVFVYDEVDEIVLTPNKLLFGRNLPVVAPSDDVYNEKQLSKRARYLDTLLDHWWHRWYTDYLVELREYHRIKGKKQMLIPNEGDVVLVADEKLKRANWKIGRIKNLIPSKDDNIRIADVILKKTGNLIRRPINKLFPIVQKDE